MIYPYNLLSVDVSPLCGDFLKGPGVFLPLSDGSEVLKAVDIRDQEMLQRYADEKMLESGTNWGISEFGENREQMFRSLGHEQMVEEGRFFHLGVDIWLPIGTPLYAPLEGEVVVSMYEDEPGNYGGLVVLKHEVLGNVFYSVYGHLDPETLPALGLKLEAGDQIAILGDMDVNGGYFYHTHLQVLTEKGFREGFVHKGYATKEDFSKIGEWCLNPNFLFLISEC